MQPIFTMQYGEFKVADYLTDNIKGSSVFIPASAQEKGIDLLLYRYGDGKNKVVTIQVKMSRTYHDHNNGFNNHLWFKRFEVQSNADWYILMGIYAKQPKGDKATNSKVADTGWNHIMLAFTNTEMESFMDSVRQKKNPEKPDSMFGFSFDEELSEIWQTRGYKEHRNMTKFLIQNRIDEIDASFDQYEKKQDIYKFIDKHPELHYYGTTLDRYGIESDSSDILFSTDITGLDDPCLEAMLVAVIRAEHHNEGTLLPAIMSGAVVKWLKKLKASDEAQIQASGR